MWMSLGPLIGDESLEVIRVVMVRFIVDFLFVVFSIVGLFVVIVLVPIGGISVGFIIIGNMGFRFPVGPFFCREVRRLGFALALARGVGAIEAVLD